MAIIISFFNEKGGIGKTTSAVNVAAWLAKSGKKVLLVDLDSQANCTNHLGYDPNQLENTIYNVFMHNIDIRSALLETYQPNLDLIPSDVNLLGCSFELVKINNSELLLKNSLKKLKGYDYIIIDCQAAFTILTSNALAASNYVIIPVESEYFALTGSIQLTKTIDLVKNNIKNLELEILGYFISRYDSRRKLDEAVKNKFKEVYANKMFKTVIRVNVALAESSQTGKSIFDYDPNCHGADDYKALTKEILRRIKKV